MTSNMAEIQYNCNVAAGAMSDLVKQAKEKLVEPLTKLDKSNGVERTDSEM